MSERSIRVLLVGEDPWDDAPRLQEVLGEVNGGMSLDLEHADRLSTGLERLAAGGIDVILSDLVLPDSKGLSTFFELRSRAPQVPIVMLSGGDDESVAAMAVQAGAQDYLVKGRVDAKDMARTIRYAIKYKEAECERLQLMAVLERRSNLIRTAAEVARAVTTISDPDALNQQVLELIRERFDLLFIGQFLIDGLGAEASEAGEWAVLRNSIGVKGRDLPPLGHKVRIGENSMVGWALANGKPCVTLGADGRSRRFKKCLVPETRSELALPLASGGEVFGALSIHSDQESAFTEEDVTVLQTMADQLANAIAQARRQGATEQEAAPPSTAAVMAAADGAPQDDYLRLILNSLQMGIVVIDAEKHEIVDVNPAAVEMIGAWKEEIVGHVCHKFICPTEDGACPITDLGQRVDRSERVLLNAQGESVPILKTATTVSIDERPHLVESILDISEWKQAQEALRQAHEDLEQYASTLERRAVQLEVAAEVAREAAGILDVNELLNETVRRISERFAFYHAGVFLVDEQGEYAVLRSASSPGGQRMLERGHKLKVGEVGIVGHVAGSGEPRIALDVGEDAVFFNNPNLPHTRSEMALPLTVRGRVIGVLDVQSTEAGAFIEEDVIALQVMADQLAIAIQNARLVERTDAQLRELNRLYGEYSFATWAYLSAPERSMGYIYDRIDVSPMDDAPAATYEAMLDPQEADISQVEGDSGTVLSVPVKLRDQVIGTVGVQMTEQAREWSADEISLVQAVSEQVALALESAHLFAEAQQRAGEQEGLARVAGLAGSTMDLDELFDHLAQETLRLMDADIFLVLLADDQQRALSVRYASVGGVDKTPSDTYFSMDAPSFERGIYARGGFYYSNTGLDDPNVVPVYRSYLEQIGVRNFCGVALLARERSIGELYVANRAAGFGSSDVTLLQTIAGYASNAIDNAQLFGQVQQRAEHERQIYEITSKLRRSPDISTILQTAVDELGRALQADRARVRLRVKPREDEGDTQE